MSDYLLEVRNAKKHFPLTGGLFSRTTGWVKAVDGVNFGIRRGETLGIVGESGCGKTTLGWLILNLLELTEGKILLEGRNILAYEKRELRRSMQVVFQDPYSSLDPRMTVEQILSEPLEIHRVGDRRQRRDRVLELLGLVGLRSEHRDRYPHEFSGGQRQRIGIARALALNPKLIVCDEPISALDVSIQSQVLNLLADLQERFGLTYLFISHDLKVVEHFSDRMLVMYLGRVVEMASSVDLSRRPLHPYSEALLAASPIPDPALAKQRVVMEGDVPSAIDPPRGCHFHTRCPHAIQACGRDPAPVLEQVAPDRWVRCARVRELHALS